MLLEVAKNLAGLHDNEVVHRDIKPDNLLRISQGAVTVWKIIDFGLACKIGETKSPGGFTLAFAAPEAVSARARVRSGETDLKVVVRPSLDAWSFGVTAYSVLSKFPEIFPPNESTLRSESVPADEVRPGDICQQRALPPRHARSRCTNHEPHHLLALRAGPRLFSPCRRVHVNAPRPRAASTAVLERERAVVELGSPVERPYRRASASRSGARSRHSLAVARDN